MLLSTAVDDDPQIVLEVNGVAASLFSNSTMPPCLLPQLASPRRTAAVAAPVASCVCPFHSTRQYWHCLQEHTALTPCSASQLGCLPRFHQSLRDLGSLGRHWRCAWACRRYYATAPHDANSTSLPSTIRSMMSSSSTHSVHVEEPHPPRDPRFLRPGKSFSKACAFESRIPQSLRRRMATFMLVMCSGHFVPPQHTHIPF